MKIKEFKPGQEAYTLQCTCKNNYKIEKYIVQSVGKKYVKVAPERFPRLTIDFLSTGFISDKYLAENKSWGNRMRLFASLEAANEEIERERLKKWFIRAAETSKIREYTLEQLRAVNLILEQSEG